MDFFRQVADRLMKWVLHNMGTRDTRACDPVVTEGSGPCLQVFQEEYSVFFLNQGGSLVAIRHTPLPIRHIW